MSLAPVPATSSAQLRRKSFPNCGRLIVLQSGRTNGFDPFAGLSTFTALNFPMMPDDIDMARSVEYLVVNSQVMPDGLHQYKATMPMVVPISFKLHCNDKEYCPKGALSLIQAASLLHSFSLPLSGDSSQTSIGVTREQSTPGAVPNGNTDSLVSRAESASSPYSASPETGSNYAPPVTLRLELLFVDDNSPGIICTGYVKDIRTRLHAPFMRGPGQSYNLPTAITYEFSFVHVPGYGNNFTLTANTDGQTAHTVQTFAENVKDKFYNTIGITKVSDKGFKGFKGN